MQSIHDKLRYCTRMYIESEQNSEKEYYDDLGRGYLFLFAVERGFTVPGVDLMADVRAILGDQYTEAFDQASERLCDIEDRLLNQGREDHLAVPDYLVELFELIDREYTSQTVAFERRRWGSKKLIIQNLQEALGELEATIKSLASNPDYTEDEFRVALAHAYHHLNFAWHIRHVDEDRAGACAEKDYAKWVRFPTDIPVG